MSDGPVFRPLAEPLRLAAIEIADLARISDGLQLTLARFAACGAPLDSTLLQDGQAADLLSQRLAGLAEFLGALADAAPEGVSVDVHDAVIRLTLAEQARRFAGSTEAAPAGAGDGELLLFSD